MLNVFLSCEHGGNQIPAEYEHLFVNATEMLNSHRGFDLGALQLFKALHNELTEFSIVSQTSRLLIDLNRSLHKRSLFSEFTKPLQLSVRQQIIKNYYLPYREAFAEALYHKVQEGNKVIHVSVHSFTPILNGVTRTTDIGILYHPGRKAEREFAKLWKAEITKSLPGVKVRFNYPYLGKPDGHVAAYRKIYGDEYAGIEIELNYNFAFNDEVYTGLNQSLIAACKLMESPV
jgi:predicted N-formylglutamate amidohydrolase